MNPKLYGYQFTPTGMNFSFNGVDITDPKLNDEFDDHVRGVIRFDRTEYADKVKTILISAALSGQAPNYKFLSEMKDADAWDWVERALGQLYRAYRLHPEDNEPIGIIPTLDRLRAQRKEKNKAKKAAKEAEKVGIVDGA